MARPEKIEQVESLKEVFGDARSIVLNDFTGLDVAKISQLRKLCREAGIEYRVVKNTLAKRSVEGTDAQDLYAHFEGPTAFHRSAARGKKDCRRTARHNCQEAGNRAV